MLYGSHRAFLAVLLTLGSQLVCLSFNGRAFARPPHPRMEVGIRCQQEYQNGWQPDVGDSDV